MLTISSLHKSFTDHLRAPGTPRSVLRGIDLTVQAGTCTALTGASGSGKSSLLRCVYGTYAADSGRVLVPRPVTDPERDTSPTRRTPDPQSDQIDMVSAGPRTIMQLRRHSIGMITQFLSVPPRVPAVDLVADAATDPGDRHDGADRDTMTFPAEEREDTARGLLRSLGLAPELHDQPPSTFSGGERQLVNIAIALARPRPVLIIDEATASLDPARRETVLEALLTRKVQGAALLAIFHEIPTTPGLIDQVCHLRDGLVQETR